MEINYDIFRAFIDQSHPDEMIEASSILQENFINLFKTHFSFENDEFNSYLIYTYYNILQSIYDHRVIDQILEIFFKKVEKEGLLKNTEVIIYGDHVLMGAFPRVANIVEPRHIVTMLPFHKERKLISKRTSIYDLAPTFMDLCGMSNYQPHFPFGASIFSQKIGMIPDNRHFRFIYDFYSGAMKWEKEVSCDGKKEGFCRKT